MTIEILDTPTDVRDDGPVTSTTAGGPVLSEPELADIHAWWRTANYLAVGQICLLANALLRRTRDEAGLDGPFRQFSFPGGIPSHVAPETPGSIHEGGELGYVLSPSVRDWTWPGATGSGDGSRPTLSGTSADFTPEGMLRHAD